MDIRERHTVSLPDLSGKEHRSPPLPQDACKIVAAWVKEFNQLLIDSNVNGLPQLFRHDCWLRDLLSLSWDFRTLGGLPKVAEYFQQNLAKAGLRDIRPRNSGAFQPSFKTPAPQVQWIQAMFDFETKIGRGSGMLRLVAECNNTWKAYALNLTLQELKGFEEQTYLNRPHGGLSSRADGSVSDNWGERRERERNFSDEEPSVFIIGAGQAGLDLAARLRQLGVPTLVIDRNRRVGDNWRNRYRTLVTHDPVQYSHMPYIPFPPNWPMFTPKDKLADWLEAYVGIMELNVWTNTILESAEFNKEARIWNIEVRRGDGSVRKLSPQHVVLATGQAGEAKVPQFPGEQQFNGVVYHASQHQDASLYDNIRDKKVVVVGSGNSGHDICQNFYESGANVTMLQRSGTYVITAEKGVFMLHAGVYEEYGPPTEEADIYDQSLPLPVQFALNVHTTERITAVEQQHLDGLTKAGFALDFGEGRSGIYRKYITLGGGYYIDVGCSQLIIDGKVKVMQSLEGIKCFESEGLILADGTKVRADIVVLATGYENMRTTARKILGDRIADQLQEAWDLDEEGEVNAVSSSLQRSTL